MPRKRMEYLPARTLCSWWSSLRGFLASFWGLVILSPRIHVLGNPLGDSFGPCLGGHSPHMPKACLAQVVPGHRIHLVFGSNLGPFVCASFPSIPRWNLPSVHPPNGRAGVWILPFRLRHNVSPVSKVKLQYSVQQRRAEGREVIPIVEAYRKGSCFT